MGKRDKVGFVLCADDFGLSPAVNAGILEAVSAERLSAVSCMATLDSLSQAGPKLQNFSSGIDIGLHLTLTDLPPLSPMPQLASGGTLPRFGQLAKASIMGSLPIDEIRIELDQQLDRFTEIFGRTPDFFDGHHHIQQLPHIQNVVFDMACKVAGKKPWLRTCDEDFLRIFRRGVSISKACLIGWPGSVLKRRARLYGIECNVGFSGIYDFSRKTPYEILFERFTDELSAGALVMCHPGRVDTELLLRDSLTDQREAELNFLLSSKFTEILSAKNLHLARFEKCFGC